MRYISLYIIVVLTKPLVCDSLTDATKKKWENVCRRVTREPFFKPELVVNKTWTIYYTWEDNDQRCLKFKFKNVTPMMIRRTRYNMHRILLEQPKWETGRLIMFAREGFKIMLFPHESVPGKFTGVPTVNVYHDLKYGLPLFRFRMKLLRGGAYLLMSECHTGKTLLASHLDPPPTPDEVEAIVSKIKFGDGVHKCVKRD